MPNFLPVQSESVTWVASANSPIRTAFLASARGAFRFPVVTGLRLRCTGTMDTGSSGGPGRIWPMVYSRILLVDGHGERINLRGSSLRVVNFMEYGGSYIDPAPIAATQTAAAFTFWLRLPLRPMKARRSADFGIPIEELIDVGRLEVQFGAALTATNYATFKTGTVYAVAEVEEGRTAEVKSRCTFRDIALANTDFSYDVNGALRYAVMYNGEVKEPPQTAWSAQKITSTTFGYPSLQDDYFKDQYIERSPFGVRRQPVADVTTTAPATEDPFITGQALAVYQPKPDQKIPEMPQLTSMHVKTDLSSFTTTDLPQMIISAIQERNEVMTAKTLGMQGGVSQLRAAVGAGALKVKLESGKTGPVHPAFARLMPLKYRGK